MNDTEKTKAQLIHELQEMRQRITELESSEVEHKQAEEALVESEEKYRALVENATDFIYMIDKNDKVLSVNKAAAGLFGKDSQAIIGCSIIELFPQDIAVQFSKGLKTVFETGQSRSSESRMIVGEREFWINVSLSPIKDQEGNVTTVMGVTRDITDRKQAEESLRLQSEILANMAEGVQVTRASAGTIVYANSKFEAMFGYDQGELIGKPVSILNAPGPKSPEDTAAEIIKSLTEKGVWSGEVYNLKKDRTPFWCRGSVSTLDHHQHGTVWVSVHEDITERKRVEETLRATKIRLEYLLSSSPAVIYTSKAYGDYGATFISENIKTQLGYKPREFLEDSNFWASHIHPDDRQRVFDDLTKLFEQDHHVHEYRFQHKDGTYRWMRDELRLIRDADGKPREIVGDWIDITDRKQAEEALAQQREHLEELVGARTAELTQAGKRIEHLNAVLKAIRNVNQLITKEKDQEKLLKGACHNLTKTRGYLNAWIALLDETQKKASMIAESGVEKDFVQMDRRLESGELPDCARKALSQLKAFVIEDPCSDCCDCPLATRYSGRGAMSVRLAYAGETYGLLTVSVPSEYTVDEEEQALFQELAEDLAFALHNIEVGQVLRESERNYRRLHESMMDAYVKVDMPGKIIEFNRAYQEMLGYSKEEISRLTYVDITPACWHEFEAKIVAEQILPRGHSEVYEKEYIRKDGTIFPVELRTFLISDEHEQPVAMWAIVRDITERKRAEEALRASESKYRTLVENIPQKIFTKDRNSVYISCNDNFARDLGITPEEFVGKTDYDFFPNELADKYRTDDQRIMEAGNTENTEKKYLQDGQEFWVQTIKTPIKDEKGNVIGILGVFWDITDRKHAEEERERLMAELAQKNKELEQIVYVTSHDLRSPLVNVQGFSKELQHTVQDLAALLQTEDIPKIIRDEVTSLMEEDIQEDLEYILSSIAKMDALLSGLLRLSRLGRAALTITMLDMNTLIAQIGNTFEFQIAEAGVTLEISELPSCKGDVTQINQVFSNLVDNALKYRDPNRPGVIKIWGYSAEAQAIYCVKDNGIGIAFQHQKNIFELFHRLNPTANPGEGLGLTIMRKILERQEGKVWVESKVGVGSKFYVSLPSGS